MTDDNTMDPGPETPEDLAMQEEMAQAMVEEAAAASETAAPAVASPPAEFNELGGQMTTEQNPAALSVLYDLSMPVAIELGRTSLSVQDILSLGRGSVIQLDRLAGEPIDVFVGDRRFAEGEVVVVGEQFGVRITRVLARTPITPAEAMA